MDLPLFQLDAFTDGPFTGNPAAVVLLPAGDPWPSDALAQAIAEENNLSETAFLHPVVPDDAGRAPVDGPAYHLRWWTPEIEVDLCGHATLASAGLLFDDVHPEASTLAFWTRSGWLAARRAGDDAVTLDFPAAQLQEATVPQALVDAVGVEPVATYRATDVVLVLADEAEVREADPDLSALRAFDVRGVVVTAPGSGAVDVVSRFFGAGAGVGEDPVTGSAHSQFARYWCERLGRTSFLARQLSARGGTVAVVLDGDRALLTGRYRRYLQGIATVPDTF
ncbi:PhzF family phenazine biosynthesis protein [Jatrophihabitans sp. YIM 134969]